MLPSQSYMCMAEHACAALSPTYRKVEDEITCLKRDISNMVVPMVPEFENSPSGKPFSTRPLVDLTLCNQVCDQVLEANTRSENVLREKAPWLLPESYNVAKTEMRNLGLAFLIRNPPKILGVAIS